MHPTPTAHKRLTGRKEPLWSFSVGAVGARRGPSPCGGRQFGRAVQGEGHRWGRALDGRAGRRQSSPEVPAGHAR